MHETALYNPTEVTLDNPDVQRLCARLDSGGRLDSSSTKCPVCGKRFTTYEKIETLPLIVIKKDNNREPYDRSKIEAGIVRSCHKRPISTAQITAVIDDIENTLFNREEREIPTMVIGELVMDHLKNLDPVAYVRFASVYREFKDIDTFMDEIKKILASN